jgi:outer membrane protein assembly factor BamB
MKTDSIYLGTAGYLVKISKTTGEIQWRTEFKGSCFFSSGHAFVALLVEEPHVFVHTIGELFCIDCETGRIIWQNPLSGLGGNIGTLASSQGESTSAQVAQADLDRARD